MEDLQQYNFTVKSNIHDYEVHFIDDVKSTLENELKEGDFIIIDNKVKALYPEWFEEVLTNFKHIGINATEPQKSYQEVEPVINELIEKGFAYKKNNHVLSFNWHNPDQGKEILQETFVSRLSLKLNI